MNQVVFEGKEYTDSASAGVYDNQLVSAQLATACTLSVDELSADIATIVVNDYSLDERLLAADDLLVSMDGKFTAASAEKIGLLAYKYADPMYVYSGNVLLGKFYAEAVNRIGPTAWQIDGISALGLLIASDYYGGIYAGETLADLLSAIISGIIEYTVDSDFGAMPMYGWLPKMTRRDALHHVLFAAGGEITKLSDGSIGIIPQAQKTPTAIPDSSMYLNGSSVAALTPASQVKVTEHAFTTQVANVEPTTLFDGEAAAEPIITPLGASVVGVLVDFDEPMYNLVATNGEILESGANYAVLGQSSAVTLVGTPYAHTQRVLTSTISTTGTPNVVSSSECCLVNVLNAENVLSRLAAYYGSAQQVDADIVLSGQRAGDAVSFTNPFGQAVTGYITNLDVTLSATVKAAATLVSGYVPGSSGNYYSMVIAITSGGTFTVPSQCNGKIRVVIIGGGNGGSVGGDGSEGSNGEGSSNGAGGAGGAPGQPGAGGQIYVVTIQTQAGAQFSVAIGAGGAGGTASTAPGAGTASTFGSYSSADGFASDGGYPALISGTVYALPGAEGVAGGSGSGGTGDGSPVSHNGQTWYPGAQGLGDSSTVSGAVANGGSGGGAAVGANGGDGGDGYVQAGGGYANGGQGGAGATPVAADDGAVAGQGGQGGHGGGGGGGAGAAYGGTNGNWPYNRGPGGAGGAGGAGAAGIVLVYV